MRTNKRTKNDGEPRGHGPPSSRTPHRFSGRSVQPTLFDGWSLLRAWGRIGSLSHLRIDRHDSQDRVEAAYTPKRRQKRSWRYGEDRRLWYSTVKRSHP
jgi:predicted DNA-binding WGR domain protein